MSMCPFQKTKTDNAYPCTPSCAVYDSKNKKCAILSIAESLRK